MGRASIARESLVCGEAVAPIAPDPADYDHVRAMILTAFRTGASLDEGRGFGEADEVGGLVDRDSGAGEVAQRHPVAQGVKHV